MKSFLKKLFIAIFSLTYFLWISDRCPSCDIQTYNSRHTGHILLSSPTVFIENIDLAGLKSNSDVDSNDTSRPAIQQLHKILKENSNIVNKNSERDSAFLSPKKYCCSQGTYSKIHQTISIHIHLPMDTTAKELQSRSQLNCSNPLTKKDSCKIVNLTPHTIILKG